MAFCTKCGKEIPEGGVCSCQQKTVNVDSQRVNNEINGMASSVKNIVMAPAAGVKAFVDGAGWLQIGVLAAIEAFIVIVFSVISKVKANIDHMAELRKLAKRFDMSVNKYCKEFNADKSVYGAGDIVKGIFLNLLVVAAIIALMAVIAYAGCMLIKKAKITWTQAFAISVLQAYVVVPALILNGLLGLISGVTLIYWIRSLISTFKCATVGVLTYLAFKSVDGNEKTSAYTVVSYFTVVELASLIVNLLL